MTDRIRVVDAPPGRVLELCRTERANALDLATVRALTAALDRAESDRVPLVALSSAGSTFCAGLDLDDAQRGGDATVGPLLLAIADLLDRLRHLPCLTVASVRGAAVGAGADLALACDHRVGTPAATFRFPGSRFGLLLGTRQLVRIVGGDVARNILLPDRRLRADEALRLGLLTSLEPDHDALSLVAALASEATALDPTTLGRMLAVTRGAGPQEDRRLVEESLAAGGMAARLDRFTGERTRSTRTDSPTT